MHSLQAANLFGISERLVRRLCAQGRIVSKKTRKPAVIHGRRGEWDIPDDAIRLDSKGREVKTGNRRNKTTKPE